MHSRFDAFLKTSLGQQLECLIDTPERYIEYAALSRAGVPAITAIVADLRARFPDITEDETARQFCGAKVADVMRRYHHELLRVRGRVPGGYFTYGAVWSPFPNKKTIDELLGELASMPERVSEAVRHFPESSWRFRPDWGTSFSLIEHVCHLCDLDEVYRGRLERILHEHMPSLPDIDGTKLARKRRYQQQSLKSAVRRFRDLRSDFVARFRRLSRQQRMRVGIYAGVKRLTIENLAEMVYEHDATHLQEIEELRTRLSDAKR